MEASPLDELLAAQVSEAQLDSSGAFTLSREKALEKLAEFQLPGPASWVSKVIQAAVAANWSEIRIQQTSTSTDITFVGNSIWTLEAIEGTFFDPETSSDRGLQHLKQGLWSVGLHGRRPFLFYLPRSSGALLWDGQALSRQPAYSGHLAVLTISHRKLEAGKGLPLLRNIEAARHNTEILEEIRSRSFACPIPLQVDSRRMDALQLCPGHGLALNSYPLEMAFLKGEVPSLSLPPGTLGSFEVPADTHREMRKHALEKQNFSPTFQVAALLCAHLKQVPQGKTKVWKPEKKRCQIYWILDGILIDCRAFDFPERSCSLGLVASAQGLTTDLSGLNLQINPQYRERLEKVCRLVDPFLTSANVNFDAMVKKARESHKMAGGLMMLGGVGLCFLSPIHGIAVGGMGAWTFFGAASEEREIVREVLQDLNFLRVEWLNAKFRPRP